MPEDGESKAAIGEQEYTIGPVKAFPGIQAIGILAKHHDVLVPLVTEIMDWFSAEEEARKPMSELAVSIVSKLQQQIENPNDLFRVVSLLSGIDEEIVKNCTLGEWLNVVKAVFRHNNVLGFAVIVKK